MRERVPLIRYYHERETPHVMLYSRKKYTIHTIYITHVNNNNIIQRI